MSKDAIKSTNTFNANTLQFIDLSKVDQDGNGELSRGELRKAKTDLARQLRGLKRLSWKVDDAKSYEVALGAGGDKKIKLAQAIRQTHIAIGETNMIRAWIGVGKSSIKYFTESESTCFTKNTRGQCPGKIDPAIVVEPPQEEKMPIVDLKKVVPMS